MSNYQILYEYLDSRKSDELQIMKLKLFTKISAIIYFKEKLQVWDQLLSEHKSNLLAPLKCQILSNSGVT